MNENRIIAQQSLESKILLETQHYNEALKNDKEFQELKQIREKIKETVTRLHEFLTQDSSVKENSQ